MLPMQRLRPLIQHRVRSSFALAQKLASGCYHLTSGFGSKVVAQAYTGVTPHTTFSVTFSAPVTFTLGVTGWVFTGSVAGALGPLVSAVLQPDGITVLFTTTVSEAAGNTVSAVYTASVGTYEVGGIALPDTTVAFGVAP